jgi:hypothetical protein
VRYDAQIRRQRRWARRFRLVGAATMVLGVVFTIAYYVVPN